MARLTEFDRAVLAVLISGGGWNAATRSRLVGVASAYGVSVQGLIKVVTGLSEYARSGGPRLEVAQITAGAPLMPAPSAAAAAGGGTEQFEWVERFAPELRDDSPASTFKLSILFGLLTVLVGVLAARVLFGPGTTPQAPEEPPAPRAVVERRPVPSPVIVAEEVPVVPPRAATFAEQPTFRGQSLTAECATAADRCPDLVPELQAIARRVTVADTPSDAVYRAWHDTLDTISRGWVLTDDHLLDELARGIFEGLYAASDKPSVTDRMLESLAPPKGRSLEPVDIWRGAWMAGTLAEISQSPGLPPAVVDRARIQLDLALEADAGEASDFTSSATVWLRRAAQELVTELELADHGYDQWEFWIAAQRRLGHGPRHDAAMLDAVDLVLATSTDLARPRPTVNVLGRLLQLVDFDSAVTRARILGLISEHERVEARDLWVVTSLLAAYGPSWFGEDLIVPETADWAFRRRMLDRLEGHWPVPTSPGAADMAQVQGIPVDPGLASRWLALFEREDEAPIAGDLDRQLDQLVTTAWLNEIALRLSIGDADTAAAHLNRLEQGALDALSVELSAPRGRITTAGGGAGRDRPGEAIGSDGDWAVAWEQARRNVEERIKLLQRLQGTAGTDLGPIDAAMFVRVAYRETPPELRLLAQDILVQQFARGPNVAIELLDQFAQAPPNQTTSEMIRRLTGRLLPSSRAESWRRETRLALVQHNLDLRNSPAFAIDERMENVLDAYNGRRACLDAEWASASLTMPHRAAAALAESWWDRAALAGHVARADEHSVPGSPVELERRRATRLRVADGPLQQFVAAQLSVLDLMAFEAAAAQPVLGGQIRGLLDESARRRSEAGHVLAQAIEAERAMGRLWKLQIAVRPDSGAARLAPRSWRLGVLAAGFAFVQDAAAAWQVRLEALSPSDPLAYFELAEEIADASADESSRGLARRLFALAGVLDPQRLGRSACLALADLETRELDKRRLLSLAALLDERGGGAVSAEAAEGWSDFDMAAALAVGEAISFYRKGNGTRALARLRTPGAVELIDGYENVFRGGAVRFMEDCRLYKSGRSPVVTGTDLVRQLRFEAALLAGGNRTWSGELLMSRGRPLVEVDPDHLDESLAVNASKPCWREGQWVKCGR